jgi:hypothetical protein
LDGVHRLRPREPNEDARVDGSHVRGGACTDPDRVVSEQALVDQDAIDIGERKGSDRAGREARCLLYLGATSNAGFDRTGRVSDLRQVDAPVAGHEDDDGTGIAEHDHRLDDLTNRATGGTGGILSGRGARFELLEPRLGTGVSQKRGDPLDGLGPVQAHADRVPAQRNRTPPSTVVSFDSVREDGSQRMNASEAEKLARTESLFREVNERIAESAARFDADETKFVCECADPSCVHRVEATLEEYNRVREDGATFLLVNGHEDERIEAIVRTDGDRAVVAKRHPLVAPIVRRLNPRTV